MWHRLRDVEQSIILTISRDRSSFEEREPVLAFERRNLARCKFGNEFGRLVRGIVYISTRLVESKSSNGGNRLDLNRSRPRVNIQAAKTACGKIDIREGLFLAVENRRTESQSTFLGMAEVKMKFDCDIVTKRSYLPP